MGKQGLITKQIYKPLALNKPLTKEYISENLTRCVHYRATRVYCHLHTVNKHKIRHADAPYTLILYKSMGQAVMYNCSHTHKHTYIIFINTTSCMSPYQKHICIVFSVCIIIFSPINWYSQTSLLCRTLNAL